jgi:hypothetical protein
MDEGQAKELQENQDLELARLLQEQEHKVRGGKCGAHVSGFGAVLSLGH